MTKMPLAAAPLLLSLALPTLLAGCIVERPVPVAASYYPPPGATTTYWRNPDGSYGTVRPIDGGAAPQDCREFQQTIIVDGRQQRAYGTTCRDANGAWKIVP